MRTTTNLQPFCSTVFDSTYDATQYLEGKCYDYLMGFKDESHSTLFVRYDGCIAVLAGSGGLWRVTFYRTVPKA